MPEGLEKDLQPQAMADVMAYVAAVQSAAATAPRVRPNGRFPRTIRPDKQGRFTLAADNCELYGPTLKYETKCKNLGFWGSPQDRAVWPIYVPSEKTYTVEIEFACDRTTAGNTISIECGRSKLAAKVPSTGNWETYRRKTIGRITLSAGQQRLTIRAGKNLKGYLIDLKTVRLSAVRSTD